MSEPTDPQAKSPVDAALDAFVYAPIGLLFEGSSVLPQLVEKGRNQVTMARMIGQFALKQAGNEVAKVASRLGDHAAAVLERVGGSASPLAEPPPPPAARAPEPRTGPSPAREAARKVAAGEGPAPVERSSTAASKPKTKAKPAAKATAPAADAEPVAVAALAIPDYDGLSASQVVNRLAGLEPDELEAVRRYELANRGRKTILSKIAQLQSAS